MRLITRLNLGGPTLQVFALSEGLDKRGYRTTVLAGVCDEKEGDLPATTSPSFPITTLRALSRSIAPLRDLAAAWTAYRLIRKERPVIVHTHTAKAGLVGRVAAFAAGVPIVLHTFHGNSLSGYFSPGVSALLRRLERMLARGTDRLCVLSNQQLEEISERFRVAPRSKFRIIPVGIDLEAELKLPLPELSGPVLRVGWLGRLVEIKNVRLLTAVIDRAIAEGLGVRFLVGGDGPERRLMECAVARHGPDRVRWTGWRRDVSGFLAECDVLIQTSRNEGTPVALIQGMAAGRPFVSTPAGGVVDLVEGPARAENGCRWHSNGILADPDPASFVDALGRLGSDRPTLVRMGSAARRFAGERFRASRLVDDVDRLYRELMDEKLREKAEGGRG